jgi:ADP-heptose:LPS heptosyltransferase
MVAVIARARLVIGNDSGPLHVATALGVRVVGLYGPTDPAFVGPYGQMENVVRHEVPCFPCRNKTCGHHSCMQGVTVELVWEKAKGMLPAGTGGEEKGR